MRVRGFRRERCSAGRAEKFDRGNEHEIRQDAAAHHERGDARTDDVTDAEQRGIIFQRNGGAFEWFPENFLRAFPSSILKIC